MRQRLERAGQRPISALVDVTNYVMLELGRPLHVYDLDKLSGGIDVRFGRKGEQLQLLNEQVVEVDEAVLCITDASGPIGLAGIMGGDSTKASLETRNIFLESAFFFPDAIAGRSRRYNFTSDAAHRFERGVDFENNVPGIERATRLILDICGGEPGPVDDVVAGLPERKPVRMRVARAQKIIGVAIAPDEMGGIFSRLGFVFMRETGAAGEAFVVTPPAYRFDIAIEEDLIEEVARVYGFERIPANPPIAAAAMCAQPETRASVHDLRRQLAAGGYREVINFSFVDAEWETDFAANARPIRLLNPIASQLAVMRSTLIGSLVANVRYNLNRKRDRVRVFEAGRVFLRAAQAPDMPGAVTGLDQPMHIGGIAYGTAFEEQWGADTRKVDFFDVKGDVESLLGPVMHETRFVAAVHPALHPGRAAQVQLRGKPIGWVGELHPALVAKYELPAAPVVFELDAAALAERPLPAYRELSKFPAVVRDLAVVVAESVSAQSLLDTMHACPTAVSHEVRLFDVYRGKGIAQGQKSLAFRVVIQDTAKTLTDEEADSVTAQLVEILASRHGAKLRT
jgi:phenylalanyl-tRNA synthetase beta chain